MPVSNRNELRDSGKSAGRTICFVTGTRAEFGLMARTLEAIRTHPGLDLKIAATGMHLSHSRGYSLNEIGRAGFKVDAVVPWPSSATAATAIAAATGRAMAKLADLYDKLSVDVVLVVGDRVEAFAAASAAQIAGRCVAHVHGGDRAPGIVDDSLRHAITKLAHIHFPATKASAERLLRLGEDRWRIHRSGSPGIDGIAGDAAPWQEVQAVVGSLSRRRFRLALLHPAGGDSAVERGRAQILSKALADEPIPTVFVYPNNDPGADGISLFLDAVERGDRRLDVANRLFFRNLPRRIWLGLLKEASVLVGNSSSGIIEAASFGTPVIDVGPRQHGREHGPNVFHTGYDWQEIVRALRRFSRRGAPVRFSRRNVYGKGNAAAKISDVLSRVVIDDRLLRKLIAY